MNASAQERAAQGKSRRDVVSRADQGKLNPAERGFDPIDLLRASNRDRIPQLLPIKYARMQESPFAFFRGSAAIMAADLGRLPHSGIIVQLCGDAHVQNLGSFAAPDGKLVFDLNDFDETILGPWEWDVKRMAASIVLAGRQVGQRPSMCRGAAQVFLETYFQWIAEFTRQPILKVARQQLRRETLVEAVQGALQQSRRADPGDLLKKFTEIDSRGRRRFRDRRPDSWRVTGMNAAGVLDSLAAYRETLAPERRHLFDLFQSIDVGFKVVGTGSVGLRDYIVLLEGNGAQDPLFLQVKQARESVYSKYLPAGSYNHQGQRVIQGQRAIQPISDLLLGWTTIGEHHFLVRQMSDRKGSIDLDRLRGGGLASLALVAGELLARGHARSGDVCAIHGYCGSGVKIVRAISVFACRYADQAESDYKAFLAAIRSGKIRAGTEKRVS